VSLGQNCSHANGLASLSSTLDAAELEVNIVHTRFAVPGEEQHEPTDDFPGLARAADLIGPLAEINYLRKTAAFYSMNSARRE
jgi:hypothetical protein